MSAPPLRNLLASRQSDLRLLGLASIDVTLDTKDQVFAFVIHSILPPAA
jgi:hypothetical protein